MQVVRVFPPGENRRAAMEGRGDGEEVVLIHGKEDLPVMGEKVLEDVDVAEAYREQGTHARRWVGDRVGSSDKRDVTRHHSMIACIRARPQRRLGKRGGHANGFSEFPIPEMVHDVGENLDG